MDKEMEYINGFNHGYILRKDDYLICKKLIQGIKNETPYLKGIKAGAKRYELEMELKVKRLKAERAGKEKGKDFEID